MSHDSRWQEPTVRDALIDGMRGDLRRGQSFIRLAILPMLALTVLAFLLPSLSASGRTPTIWIVVAVVLALQVHKAVRLQQRLGRPTSRAVAAGFGVAVVAAIVLVPFVLVSWNFGPSVAEAPLTSVIEFAITRLGVLPFVILSLGLPLALLVVADRRFLRARRVRIAEETEAAIAQERAARAESQLAS
jgi:hypothetical protein